MYLGTLEGYCFCYHSGKIGIEIEPVSYNIISDNAIDGIVFTQHCAWVSHKEFISFLNFRRLTVEGCISHVEESEHVAYMGQLSLSSDSRIVWSAHIGGVLLSAWDAQSMCRCQLYI